ncbi:hypothetical protein BGZ95_011629 [Linnemannia exigua]|uniref:Uncharacterized protein n=1 Tax=Linnemannia exigua TaxID=604196 RepID=A0AAD4D9K9_9FUNG|nr:hypothetical protein BGZ95_011629 [Linnemannia exigua]
MQLTVFAFAALASVVAAAEWPEECKYKDGLACYRYCATAPDGSYQVPTETQALCHSADPRNPIEKDSYEYSRVFMRLPLSSKMLPQPKTEDGVTNDPWKFEDRCFCFRSLTEDEIAKASPVSNIRDDKCKFYSIRCLRMVEFGDMSSCAESYFRCKEQKDAEGSDTRAELCQRFKDIDSKFVDAIQAIKDQATDSTFTPEDKAAKVKTLERDQKEFNTRREVSCEGTANGVSVKDPEAKN